MLVDRNNLSRHLPWITIVVVGTCGAAGWYLMEYWRSHRWPGGSSLPGLVLGVAAAVIMFFELLLWPRKRLRTWRIGRAQSWLRAHIWLGLLSVPLVALHSGGEIGGALSRNLLIVFTIVIASGLWGLALQQFLPKLMLDRVSAETIYAEIEHISLQNCYDAEDLVQAVCGVGKESDPPRYRPPQQQATGSHLTIGAYRTIGKTRGRVLQTQAPTVAIPNSDALRTAFYAEIGPYLKNGGGRGRNGLGNPRRAADLFHELKGRLDPAAHPIVDEIQELCFQRQQFDVQARLHRWLHSWLLVHAPLSVMLVALLIAHIYFACKYW